MTILRPKKLSKYEALREDFKCCFEAISPIGASPILDQEDVIAILIAWISKISKICWGLKKVRYDIIDS